jgi:hypothetical protein
MKTRMSVFAILFVMAAVLMVSCDKDETATSLSVNLLKKATVKGYVYAQLDLTADGLEKAPAGTKVLVSIPYSYLNSSASGNYKDTAVVNDQGFFEIEVPVGNTSAYITFIPIPFETSQVQSLGSVESPLMKYYTADTYSINLSASDFEIIQITYTANDYADYVELAQISGIFRAETNDTISGTEVTREGIELVFHGYGWNKTVTTTAGGAYSITVPANNIIYVDYSFTAQHVVWSTHNSKYLPVLYIYEGKSQYVSDFSPAIIEDFDISAGYGQEVE